MYLIIVPRLDAWYKTITSKRPPTHHQCMMVVHQQLRVIRLAMLLVIGALTIFIYASYYTSPMVTTRIVTSSSSSSSSSSLASQSDYETSNINDERHLIEVANNELLRFDEAAAASDGQSMQQQPQLMVQQTLDELQPSSVVVALQSESGQLWLNYFIDSNIYLWCIATG